jgi:hypothetical protein
LWVLKCKDGLVNEASGFYKKKNQKKIEILKNRFIINMKFIKLIIIKQTCVEVAIILQQVLKNQSKYNILNKSLKKLIIERCLVIFFIGKLLPFDTQKFLPFLLFKEILREKKSPKFGPKCFWRCQLKKGCPLVA